MREPKTKAEAKKILAKLEKAKAKFGTDDSREAAIEKMKTLINTLPHD